MIAASLGRVAQLWLNRTNSWRQDAVTALQVSTGFSREMVEDALSAAFEKLSEEKIQSYISTPDFQTRREMPDRVLHILAGNVFTSWLPGAVVTLLTGAECHLKPSSKETLFPSLWKISVEQIDPVLGRRIHIVPWEEQLLERYPAVVAYGSDATLTSIRKRLSDQVCFVGYGHKLSVAVIWKEALKTPTSDVLASLEKDVKPFDLAGCLSPQLVLIEGEDPGLFEALFSRVNVMPHFKRFGTQAQLLAQLQALQPYLSTLGYAGPERRIEALRPELDRLGFTRICPLGEMQRPPLSWRNGGISLIETFNRFDFSHAPAVPALAGEPRL